MTSYERVTVEEDLEKLRREKPTRTECYKRVAAITRNAAASLERFVVEGPRVVSDVPDWGQIQRLTALASYMQNNTDPPIEELQTLYEVNSAQAEKSARAHGIDIRALIGRD